MTLKMVALSKTIKMLSAKGIEDIFGLMIVDEKENTFKIYANGEKERYEVFITISPIDKMIDKFYWRKL